MVVDLDAVQPGREKCPDEIRLKISAGVGKDRETSRFVNGRDDDFGRKFEFLDIAGPAGIEVAVKRVFDVLDESLADQGRRDMGSSRGFCFAGLSQNLFVEEVDAGRAQFCRYRKHPFGAPSSDLLDEPGNGRLRRRVNEQAQDMEFGLARVGRELATRNNLDSAFLSPFQRCLNSRNRVVIGDRHRRKPGLLGGVDERVGIEFAIRSGAVKVKVGDKFVGLVHVSKEGTLPECV